MLRNNWLVGEHAVRPAGKPDECFYCNAKVGAQHRSGCVIRSRTVLIKTIVEHTIDVPEDWPISMIEFTEGSSCSDNMIRDLQRLVDRLNDDGCTCGMVTREFIREATAEDETESKLHVADADT
jgi:hypothetical protein